jgi:hypothetical protein
MGKTKQHSIITFHTKEGTFIAYPPNNEKLCIKAEKTAKGQMITVGYFNIIEKTWQIAKGMKVPFGVKSVIEETYA